MPHAGAEALKNEGNNFFKKGQYKEAIEKYDAASKLDPSVPAYYSNAAACHEKLGNYEAMAEAGRNCIKADRLFVKGYFRLATAQKALNDLPECIKTLENGLGIEATNADLKKMKKDITELQRADQVASYCMKAKEQEQSGDIPGAMKTLELASRLDAGNSEIERLLRKVKPQYEASRKNARLVFPQSNVTRNRETKPTRMPISNKRLSTTPSASIPLRGMAKETRNLLSRHIPIALLAISRLVTLMELLLTALPSLKWNTTMSRL